MRGLLCVLISFTATSCIFSSEDIGPVEPLGGSRSVEGLVVDFETMVQPAGDVSISTSGLVLTPEPEITIQGPMFTIKGIPENSAFQIKASAEGYHTTFSEAVVVETMDKRGVRVPVVSNALVNTLATSFGIQPTATRGVLIGRVVDDAGNPKAGVAKTSFLLDASVSGPFFLGDMRQPLPNAMATTSSGLVIWFEVAPGVATLNTSATSTTTLDMAVSPVAAASVTMAEIRAKDGPPPMLPTNVSFRNQIIPIFGPTALGGRGCEACHSGNGIGRDLGGLTLNGGAPLIYRELVEEDPLRVQTMMPERSQLLTYPSREDPPDRHPNVTFQSPADPDYVKILVWIREGAKDN